MHSVCILKSTPSNPLMAARVESSVCSFTITISLVNLYLTMILYCAGLVAGLFKNVFPQNVCICPFYWSHKKDEVQFLRNLNLPSGKQAVAWKAASMKNGVCCVKSKWNKPLTYGRETEGQCACKRKWKKQPRIKWPLQALLLVSNLQTADNEIWFSFACCYGFFSLLLYSTPCLCQ